MLHVINRDNRHLYHDSISQMWRQRHDIFIKKLGWKLDTNGVDEIDAYDTEDAVYLVRIDEKDDLKGSIRLLPTKNRHLMSDLFSQLCISDIPSGETIWEISRFYSLTARHNRLDKDKTMNEIVVGLMHYAINNGIKKLTCVASMSLFPTLLGAGWDIQPLGLPTIADKEVILAFCIDVTDEGLKKVQKNRGTPEQGLFQYIESKRLATSAG